MKTKGLHPFAALTLLEMLVAIGVVAVALMLLFPAIPGPRGSAPKAKAGMVVKNIVNACKAYESDHGGFPAIAAALDERGGPGNPYMSFGDPGEGRCKVDNNQLFNVLRAISAGPNVDHVLNRRQTRYFEDAKAHDPKRPREGFTDGPDFPDGARGRLMDPWGVQYGVVLETDKDATVNLGAFYQDLAGPANAIRSSAVAFSLAKDGKLGGKTHEGMFRPPNSNYGPDDVASWQ